MALQTVFEDERGVKYDTSYWRITNIGINVDGRTANFTFAAYKDKTARDAKKSSIGSRGYSICGDQFDVLMLEEDAGQKNLRTILYDWAKSYKDVATGEWVTENANTPNARPVQVMKSFFDSALDV